MFWFLLLLGGCTNDWGASLSGTVFLDGKAIDGGSVAFCPVEHGTVSMARIQSNGHYELRTGSKVGIAPGDYVVTVIYRRAEPELSMTQAQVDALDIAPTRYRNKLSSDLRFTVKPGTNTFDIKMTSNK